MRQTPPPPGRDHRPWTSTPADVSPFSRPELGGRDPARPSLIKLAAVWVGAMVLLAVIGLAITVLTRASGRHAEVPPTPLQAAPALPVAPTPERDPVPALQASKPHEPALDPRGDGDDSGAFSVRVDLDAPEIRGHLSTEAVHRVLRRHSNEVRYCYERELRGSPELAGDVRIRAIVSPTGLVQTAMVQSTSLHNTSVERCILQAVQRWPFPAPEGGGIVIFNQRFVLSRD